MKIHQSAWMMGVVLFAMATGAHAVVEAGRVQFVFGVAHAIGGEGGQRQLAKAQPVYAGETIVTGPTASLQLRMIDKAVLAIRPNSKVHIDTYHLGDSSGQAILRLVQGSLRSVTGLIGQFHSDKYRIITNRAYLGVRGTDHEPSHILPGAAGGAEPGTYDKVNTGATFLTGPGGRIDLDPNEVGFASNSPGATPVRLEGVPAFMRSTPAIAEVQTIIASRVGRERIVFILRVGER